jgi:hypothetical protein
LETLEDRLTPSSTQFAVIGDYGSAGTGEASVANLVKSWNPDYIITLGDNNYPNGSAAGIDANIGQYYHAYIGNYTGSYGAGSATNRFFPALGNHDWQTTSGSPALPTPYLNYFTLPGNERYYTFTQGPVQFFCIDSGNGAHDGTDSPEPDGYSSTSVQGQWLKAQLAASTAQWKIVYFHHPAYSSGYFGDNTVMQWPFAQWGATAVMAGSDHDYERINVGGLTYFVNGIGGESYGAMTRTADPGSQVYYGNNYGAMKVTATDTQIQFQEIAVSGSIIDTYTIQATNAPPTVSVAATDATANEQNPSDTGTFTISRTGSTAAALTVNLAVGGTATNGADYTTIANTVTIPAGASSVNVTVTPINDGLSDGNETVTLTVAASTGYSIGSANTATVTIQDAASASTTLIPTGSVWKYLDNGSNQGTAWQATGFNDSAWKSGPAQLGYGDGDEATVVGYGPNANAKYITTYFRTAFTVNNAAAVSALNLRLIRDDGAVVYLNGTEVFRSNMPTGAINYTTLASSAVTGADESTFYPATVNPSLLVNGTNYLAVEIHQCAPDSSDISFDLGLDATVNVALPPAPSKPVLTAASDNGLANNDNYTSITTPTFTGTAPIGNTVRLYSDGLLVGTAVAANGAYMITSNTLTNGVHAITATDTDSSGNTSPASAALSVTIDTVSPTVSITAVSPNPTTTAVNQLSIVFSEFVSGLTVSSLKLSLNGGPNLLTSSQTLVTADGITWTLGNLAGLTTGIGSYALTLTASGSGVTDRAGNPLVTNAIASWQMQTASTATTPLTPLIIDNGAPGTATVGTWTLITGSGFRNDYLTGAAGTGTKTATWTFSNLTPGLYRVSANWLPASNRATNSPYTILQGTTVLGTVTINQQVAPAGFTDSGATWTDLGGPYQVTGATLTIQLTDKANGVVVADGMRIQRLSPETAAGIVPGPNPKVAPLTQAALDATVTAALNRWASWAAASGVTLVVPSFQATIADLPSGYLGVEGSNTIWIDRDAAGRGWFVDPTPNADSEFALSGPGGELLAAPGSPAYGKYDLLTAVMHELGHVMGMPDDGSVGSVMDETLTIGTRRLPSVSRPSGTTPFALNVGGLTLPNAITRPPWLADLS